MKVFQASLGSQTRQNPLFFLLIRPRGSGRGGNFRLHGRERLPGSLGADPGFLRMNPGNLQDSNWDVLGLPLS